MVSFTPETPLCRAATALRVFLQDSASGKGGVRDGALPDPVALRVGVSRRPCFLGALLFAPVAARRRRHGSPADLEKELAALRPARRSVAPGTPAAKELSPASSGGSAQAYLEQGDTGARSSCSRRPTAGTRPNGLVLADLTLAYVRAENFRVRALLPGARRAAGDAGAARGLRARSATCTTP